MLLAKKIAKKKPEGDATGKKKTTLASVVFLRKPQRRLRGQAHTTSRDEIQPAEQITGAHCWFGGGEEGDHRAEPDRAVILETTTIPRGVWVLRKRTPYTRESQIKVYVGEDFFLLAVRHIPHTALPS